LFCGGYKYGVPIPGSKREAFERDFPFIKAILNEFPRRLIIDLRVQLADEALSRRERQSVKAWEGDFNDVVEREKLYILDRDGNILTVVGQRERVVPATKVLWFKFPERTEPYNDCGATLEGELRRMGTRAEEAFYVLSCIPVGPGGPKASHVREISVAVTLCKPPKNFTLAGWLEELVRREQAAIQAKLAEIDDA